MSKVKNSKTMVGVPRETLTIREVIINANSPDMFKAEKAYHVKAEKLSKSKDALNLTQGNISEQLMIAAIAFGTDVELFLSSCELEQDFLKSDDAGKLKVDKMSNAWIQAKSRIKAAMLEGLNPASFDTESSMREEVKRIKDERKNGEALTVEDAILESVKTLMEVLHNVSTHEQAQVATMVDSLTDEVKLYLALEEDVQKVA